MDNLWTRNDRPIPASYWVAASIGSVVILVSYATAIWVPWFLRDMAGYVPNAYMLGTGLLLLASTLAGVLMATVPWLALRWPAVAIAIAVLPIGISLIDPNGIGVHFGVFVALCTIVLTTGWRSPGGAIVAAATAAAFVVGWLFSDARMSAPFRAAIFLEYKSGWEKVGLGASYLVVVSLVGLIAWRMRVSGLGDLERRALAARSGDVEQQAAVVSERARLARDLHDVVAHHVSLIAVRAETAPYTHPDLDPQARTVLGDIAADARLALDELRGVLGILGRSGEGAERAPQPTWRDIAALVERTRSAGVEVHVVGDTSADVAPGAGYVAYRVVQEALTNARKHAPGVPVTLDLEVTSQLLTMQVSTPLVAGTVPGSPGHGLVGMRERVEALGGRLLSGPVGEDFVVEAILPRAAA